MIHTTDEMHATDNIDNTNNINNTDSINTINNINMTQEVSARETEVSLKDDNRGVGVVEIILILVVLIALVLVFKEQLGAMVSKAMGALEKSVEKVLS